jgi:hypothetical protein
MTLPFSVVPGKFSGQIDVVPRRRVGPLMGHRSEMWISSTAGGAPLASSLVRGNFGSEGALNWDQTGAISYGCPIPNQKG